MTDDEDGTEGQRQRTVESEQRKTDKGGSELSDTDTDTA